MISVLHKELEFKVGKLKYKKLDGDHACIWVPKPNPNFKLVNKSSQTSTHEVLQSWLINTVYNLLVNNNSNNNIISNNNNKTVEGNFWILEADSFFYWNGMFLIQINIFINFF